ncbi:MAG: single-stranded DNA-binding protein [Candidatus Dojkabacteria bacterium]|nr:single-stranded DNA-binding protein [Candidatus Dojkabacteria bacterium]
MFGDINKIELMGNVVRDPELRFTPSGAAVLNFSLATNRSYRVGEEWKDEVSFHNIVVWRNAESLAKRLQKGTRVFLEGRSHTRSWDSDDGKKNYRTEVIVDKVILISRYTGGEGDNSGSDFQQSSGNSSQGASSDETINPDDLPF